MNRTSSLSLAFVAAAISIVACASKPTPEPQTGPQSSATATTAEPKTPEPPTTERAAPQFKAGPGGFPLPPDAEKDANKSVGSIEVFIVERGKDAVLGELRAALEADGWKIESEEPSPSNAAMRLVVSKGGQTFKASVTGDEGKAAIIVTPPKP